MHQEKVRFLHTEGNKHEHLIGENIEIMKCYLRTTNRDDGASVFSPTCSSILKGQPVKPDSWAPPPGRSAAKILSHYHHMALWCKKTAKTCQVMNNLKYMSVIKENRNIISCSNAHIEMLVYQCVLLELSRAADSRCILGLTRLKGSCHWR